MPPLSPLAGAGSAAATVVASGLMVFAGMRLLDQNGPASSALRIVPLQVQVVAEQPIPEPEPEPEPEPVQIAQPEPIAKPQPIAPKPKPAPVVVAQAPRPRPLPVPEPIRAPAPRLERPAPLPAPAPVARRVAPPVQIDAPRAPTEPVETASQSAWRPPSVETHKPASAPAIPRVAIDGVSGPPTTEVAENPARVSSLAPGVPGPRHVAAPVAPRMAPPAAVSPTLPGDEPIAALPSRATPTAPLPARSNASPGPTRPVAFAGAASPSETAAPHETPSATRERVAAAPLPARAARSEPENRLRGVPLSALAACRTDEREDKLKLAVIAAVGKQKECSSAAGSYRFVETKNLNAFLMWIERAPGRTAVDRCGELTHALSCLSKPGAM